MKCCKEEVILYSLPVPSSIPAIAESNARCTKAATYWIIFFLNCQIGIGQPYCIYYILYEKENILTTKDGPIKKKKKTKNQTPSIQEISFIYVSRKAHNMSPNSIIKRTKFGKKEHPI